ncbi:MAG: FN3 associated domain-containing protein, partial [Candidatus Borkfalkiaceae bacterium]|nr:FN3 associated domain-containing protein [Christensenellaceae bacterium]
MKKLLVAVLMAAMLCCSAVSVAFAASMPSVTKSNVTSKLSDEAVKVTDLAGNEVSLAAGPHGGSGAKSVFTDGTISSTATARLVDAEGNGVIGYVTLDAGAEYVVDSLLIDLCHDWGAADFIVQLSVTEDFSSPVTVFNNKAGEKFSADASRKTDDVVYNVPYQGLTFSFSPVRARYVRVTCDIVGNGKRQGYTTLGEIQLYSVEGSVVYTDALGQVADGRAKLYAAEEGAEIYYTTDGSAPTVRSALYKNGIALDGEITVRAISYKDGKYGVPCDFTFSGKAVFVSENAALGKTVKAYLKDGTEATVTNHNGGQTLACVTDGVMGAENSIQLDGQLGWIQVDLGASVWINRAVLNLWHDHVWRSITVQLSDDETFATGVQTIVCTDAGNWNGLSAYVGTLDPSWADRCNTEWIAGHTGANGFEFNFAP